MANAFALHAPVYNFRARPQVTTGFDANHPVHNCLDASFDSYAYPTAAAHSITVDTDANYGTFLGGSATHMWVWLANYYELLASPNLQIKLETSGDAAFTTPVDYGTITCDATRLPFVMWDLGGLDSNRYIRWTYSASNVKAKTALVGWGLTYTFARQHEWEQPERERYFNAIDNMGAGRVISRNFRGLGFRQYQRLYRMVSDAMITDLRTVYSLTRGQFSPLFLRDDPDTATDRTVIPVRFLSDEPEWTPRQYDLNDVALSFAAEPYTQDQMEW
jgi:hypothetical protein